METPQWVLLPMGKGREHPFPGAPVNGALIAAIPVSHILKIGFQYADGTENSALVGARLIVVGTRPNAEEWLLNRVDALSLAKQLNLPIKEYGVAP